MIRWLLKLVIFLVLAGLAYGFFLLYREKTPEEQKRIRSSVGDKARRAAGLVEEAGARALEKGRDVFRDSRRERED